MVDGTSQMGNDKAIGSALSEVFSDWLPNQPGVNRADVFVTSRSCPALPLQQAGVLRGIFRRPSASCAMPGVLGGAAGCLPKPTAP